MAKRNPQAGHNAGVNAELLAIVERIERLREEKGTIADDESAVFAEAKATGFDVKGIRRVLKRRQMKPHDLEEMEAIDDVYNHALGLARDLPLFRAVGAMAVDRTARDSVVAALTLLVPDHGQIVMTVSGQSVRLWRDDKGDAHSEDVHAPAPATPAITPSGRDDRRRTPPAEAPDVDDEGARELGRQAAKDNVPIVKNPFPWNDHRRQLWDSGWRDVSGGDGMGPDS